MQKMKTQVLGGCTKPL